MKNFMTFWFKKVILKSEGKEKLIDYDKKYTLDTNIPIAYGLVMALDRQ